MKKEDAVRIGPFIYWVDDEGVHHRERYQEPERKPEQPPVTTRREPEEITRARNAEQRQKDREHQARIDDINYLTDFAYGTEKKRRRRR